MEKPSTRKVCSDKSDEDLLHIYKVQRNPEVIHIFYHRYAHLVFGVCLKYLKDRELAEDITMHVFEKILNKLHQYNIQHFKSWLHTLVKNECLMLLRRKNIFVPLTENIKKTNGTHMDFYEEMHLQNTEDSVRIDQLNAALNNLCEEQKKCITLFYLENKSYNEIEETTGFSIKQVKSYIQNGKRNLKKRLVKG